jgi:hypothetical protein
MANHYEEIFEKGSDGSIRLKINQGSIPDFVIFEMLNRYIRHNDPILLASPEEIRHSIELSEADKKISEEIAEQALDRIVKSYEEDNPPPLEDYEGNLIHDYHDLPLLNDRSPT